MQPSLIRRSLLGAGLLGAGAFFSKLLPMAAFAQAHKVESAPSFPHSQMRTNPSAPVHSGSMIVGDVDNTRNSFDPRAILTNWDAGQVSKLPNGQTLRNYQITVEERDIEIAPGVFYPAWTYNGRVPGPTLRVTEGDLVRIRFANRSNHPHTIHFHGIHTARQDGVPGTIEAFPSQEVIYEFEAKPFGCHLYHCHSAPFKRHLHKGLYGAFIIDPDPTRHPNPEKVAQSRLLGSSENAQWQEFLMVLNGFDTNFDEENDFYAVNTIPHEFMKRPIRIERDRPVRIYLINVTEFDPINSFHLHANFFDYFDHGTTLTPTLPTVDTVMLCQAQRGILEFSFQDHEPGVYMFHAHQSEFLELGWMSAFEVVA
ncbi:MAG: multicopper oxidase domain-containing protein [Acaryochloridaceae cyanobacterium CSU_3_4]|nr:multicopper oxidase domain-containing protein [Acaryochloridaceae cyanobacterium CSU_3_4]